jgi:hypothetical protein
LVKRFERGYGARSATIRTKRRQSLVVVDRAGFGYIGAVTRSTRHISRRPARPCSTTLSIPTIVLSLGPTAAQKQDLIAYLQTLSRRGQADGSG